MTGLDVCINMISCKSRLDRTLSLSLRFIIGLDLFITLVCRDIDLQLDLDSRF